MFKTEQFSLQKQYPTLLLFFILGGSILLSFTPYWLDPTTLFDNKRFFIIFYLLCTAIVLLVSWSVREKVIVSLSTLSRTNGVLLALAVAAATVANFTSLYWVKSQAVFSYALMLMIVTTLLTGVILKHKNIILRLYVWLTFTIFLSVFLFHILATWQGDIPNYRYLFSFVNPRNINHIQIWLILPLLYWAWSNKGKAKSWMFAIPVVIHFSLLLALDARGAVIASFTGILLWILLSEKKVEKLKWVLTLVACGLLLKWLLFTPLPQYFIHGVWPDGQGEIRLSDSNRLNLWSNAIAMMSFWGHGGDTFVCNNDVIAHSPHNSILLMAVEWGVITALCYIVLLLHTFYRVCITTDETLRILGLTVLSGFAYSFISGVLNTPLSQGLATISVAIYWASVREVNTSDKESKSRLLSSKASTLAHLCLIFIALWSLIFIGYKTYQRIDNNQYRHIKLDYYMPQFWIEHNCMDAESKLN